MGTMNMEPNRIFFTSDTHFGHDNIIGYCGRPFKTVTEMDQTLEHNWNEKVPEDGIVFLIGDVSFHDKIRTRRILWNLNGTIHLILGNHDKSLLNYKAVANRFESVQDYLEISVLDNPRQRIVMCHYPIKSWNKMVHGSWNLHGHCHGTLKQEGKQFDVGVDTNHFYPYSYFEIKDKLEQIPVKLGVDYHRANRP